MGWFDAFLRRGAVRARVGMRGRWGNLAFSILMGVLRDVLMVDYE